MPSVDGSCASAPVASLGYSLALSSAGEGCALERHRHWLHGKLAQDIETLQRLFRELEAAGYPFERKPQMESVDAKRLLGRPAGSESLPASL